MPFNRRPHAVVHQPLHQVRADDVLPELLLLQELEVLERRTRVHEVLEVGRPGPVLQIGEVGDEVGAGEELLRCEMIEVEWVCECLDELRVMRR